MHYVKTKGMHEGPCKICTRTSMLTWDHVPPKGGITLEPVEIEQVFQALTGDGDGRRFRISQNGLKFRTICKPCNEILGSRYDHVLNEFAIGVGRFLKSNLQFPPVINYRTKPMSLIRSILGHMLAAKVDLDNASMDRDIRSFVFDENMSTPDNIHIFYWIYPYNQSVIVRDIGMPSIHGLPRSGEDFGIFNILKYFPIAYLVTDLPEYEGLEELTKFRDLKSFQEAAIAIRLNSVRSPSWPENTEDDNIILMTQGADSSLRAIPMRKKR